MVFFNNLASLKFLNLQTYVPNTLPADVLRGLNLQSLKLSLQSTALPYDSMCSQQNLFLLHLGDNKMEKLTLPKCVSNMTMLSTLMLNSNKFTTLFQADFAVLENSALKVLSLSNCRIVDVHEDAFQPLVYIATIYMDGNRISHLPQNVFRNSRNLTFLNLAKNRFTELPCDVFRHVKTLKSLFLQNLNEISNAKVCQQFVSLPRLFLLYMYNTRMEHVNDTDLLPINQVRSLRLTAQSFSKESLAAVPHLNNLLLEGGHINLTGLTNVVIGLNQTDIRTLTVRYMPMKFLPGGLFFPLRSSQLTSLSLSRLFISNMLGGMHFPL